jgi:hypothetical protein
MPYELIWEKRGVIKRHYGVLTDNEVLSATQQVGNHEQFTQLRYIINDFTDVESGQVSPHTIEEIAALRIGATHVNRHILSPYVATRDPGLSIANALLSPDYRNDHPTRLFPNMAAARAWIDAQLNNAVHR